MIRSHELQPKLVAELSKLETSQAERRRLRRLAQKTATPIESALLELYGVIHFTARDGCDAAGNKAGAPG
jgi:hypothetical protein